MPSSERLTFFHRRMANLSCVEFSTLGTTSTRVVGRVVKDGAAEHRRGRAGVYRSPVERVDSFHMRQKRPVTKLGADVEELMAAAGMRKNVELAKAADVSESTVGRI